MKQPPKNFVSRADSFRISKELDAQWAEFEAEKMTLQQIRDRVATCFDMPKLTTHNVASIIDDMGRELPVQPAKAARNPATATADLIDRVASLEDSLQGMLEMLTSPDMAALVERVKSTEIHDPKVVFAKIKEIAEAEKLNADTMKKLAVRLQTVEQSATSSAATAKINTDRLNQHQARLSDAERRLNSITPLRGGLAG